MLTIEIMRRADGCPMKCFTCPDHIQKGVGTQGDLIPKAYELLQKKIGTKTPFGISFTSDFSDMAKHLEEFNVQHVKGITSHIKPLSDISKLKEVFEWVADRFPEVPINIGFDDRRIEISDDIACFIENMAKTFFETNAVSLQVSMNNNSTPLQKFRERQLDMVAADQKFFARLIESIGLGNEYYHGKKYELKEVFDFEAYHSILRIKKSKSTFQMTRRAMTRILQENFSARYYFQKRAQEEVNEGDSFIPENVTITLTPMGVRINHSAFDVENPYFWITYDELFHHLEFSSTIDYFCDNLGALVNMTLNSELDDKFFISLNEDSINEIAEIRKKHFRR